MTKDFRLYILGLVGILGSVALSYFWTASDCDTDVRLGFYKENMNTNLSAFVLGGTGGVGSSIIRALAKEPRFAKVVCVGRRKIEFPQSDETFNYNKFEQQILPDFDKIIEPENAKIFQGLDVGFYTIGVSIRKTDEATYRKVEYGYSSAVAKFAIAGGCQHFHYVSGQGVNKDSMFLIRRVKFQIEDELGKLRFPRLSIYRPAGILTDDNSGGMAGTGVVRVIRFLDRWNIYSVEAEVLGNVIVASTFRESDKPIEVIQNSEVVELGKELDKMRSNPT